MSIVKVENKKLIREFSKAIHQANSENIEDILKQYYHDDAVWYGPHPINELKGREALAEGFWKPFSAAFPDVQKEDYILFGGTFNGEDWVCATGNFVGTFTNDWLDIPATQGSVWIRYGEFHKMVDGKITETRIMIDLLDVMRQAGYSFFSSLAPEMTIPGPATFDGVILRDVEEKESKKSLQLVEDMIFKGLLSFKDKGLKEIGMEQYWHHDMMWYGPCGIGSTRGIKGFQAYHQAPFLKAFPDRIGGYDDIRFGEGNYCALVGWPSLIATHTGGDWLGIPATNKKVEMRVMDFWRREGDLLAENWVFIDMIDLLLQMGIDVFDRLKGKRHLVK